MTLKQRVFDTIMDNAGVSHREIAGRINADAAQLRRVNVASIRRITQQFYNTGSILKRTALDGTVEFYPVYGLGEENGAVQAYDTNPAAV